MLKSEKRKVPFEGSRALRLVNSEWGGLANLSSEICALFAVWQEFLHFEEFTIAYCNTHTDTRTHTHTGCFKAVCTKDPIYQRYGSFNNCTTIPVIMIVSSVAK